MRIVMMGTGTFAEPTFEELLRAGENVVGLVTQPDRDSGNKRGSTRQTGKGMVAIAAGAGVPVIQPESINTPDGLAALRAFQPDLLVVAAYGQILKPEVIGAATHGAINVHASLLPKYRGASPIAHAILNGETRTGVTIINITPGLDAGDMLAQEAVDIDNETTGELEARLAPLGARLCLDVIQRIKAGPVSGTKQDPALVTKAPKLKKEHGLIDWTQPAEKIASHVRAMQPWPTAYTFFHRPGKEPMRVIVCRAGARSATDREAASTPGELLAHAERGRLIVRAGGVSVVEPMELQPAGKKRMTAEEFLRGYPIQHGYRFGPA
ncbi:MAG: methionyl-tRNA formyltransferase [Fimbriiglobus sp.]|jgi:methionyl-tRNA formyltransferase|nr:methionyl-tRNA formyltransferase [Fimbriiglobus sp.]